MYLLYIASIGYIIFKILRCVYPFRTNTNLNKLDSKKNYSFLIKDIEFNTCGEIINLTRYNNYYFKQLNIELNVNFLYNYYVVNYIYNDTKYKYFSENNFLTFPIYSEEQIKNYVYINKISKAILLINNPVNNDNITDDIDYIEEHDILNIILPYLGPNYNFYKDLNIKLSIKDILKHEFIKEKDNYMLQKLDFNNRNYIVKLYDNFNNEYVLESDYLRWNPELKL